MQSRTMSFIESCANIAIGFGVALGAQVLIFPVFDIHVGASDHMLIGAFFTAVSLARSFAIRRLFNGWGGRRV